MPTYISETNVADMFGTSLATTQNWADKGIYPSHTNECGKRGFYMDIEEIPGQIVTREKELASAVRKAVSPKDHDAELDHFLTRYMGACDGNATDRIAAWMR